MALRVGSIHRHPQLTARHGGASIAAQGRGPTLPIIVLSFVFTALMVWHAINSGRQQQWLFEGKRNHRK